MGGKAKVMMNVMGMNFLFEVMKVLELDGGDDCTYWLGILKYG